MTDILAQLSAPFDPSRVSWRVGSINQEKTKGMALAYIDSRDVQERLDVVMGANWQCSYPHAGQKTVCAIGLKIDSEWIWRADGAGDSDVEAEKGALSDAFKRAAVKWGIGRYLYDLDSPWVQIVQKGRSYVIADTEKMKLAKLLPGSKMETAPKPKSAPGISEARTWVNEEVRGLNSVENGDDLLASVKEQKLRYIRICSVYPELWIGPDGSGLRGECIRIATICRVDQDMRKLLTEIETEAKASKPSVVMAG